MSRKLAIVFLWLFITPLIILFSASSLFLNQKSKNDISLSSLPQVTIDENPSSINGQVLGIAINDVRVRAVANFLKNTPLEEHSQYIVSTSDDYGLDYRLIPAIAMKETSGGTNAPTNSYNAWGFGNGHMDFRSWENAIEYVARTLKEDYADRGLVTPEQIMPVYAPPQIHTGGKWAKDINFFFEKIQIF